MVELTLAMTFISVMLVTIALLVIQITAIYQKGVTISTVNSVGRELIDEFSRVIGASPIIGIDPDKNGYIDDAEYRRYFIQTSDTSGLTSEGHKVADQPVHGVFCTGQYSYLWNTGYAMNLYENSRGASDYRLGYKADGKAVNYDFRLLRVPDDGRRICALYSALTAGGEKNILIQSRNGLEIDGSSISVTIDMEPEELLSPGENDLALYDLQLFPASVNESTGHAFYSGTFILATLKGGVDIYSSGDFCRETNDSGEITRVSGSDLTTDFSYCAINKFNFAMRSTGRTSDDNQDQYGER